MPLNLSDPQQVRLFTQQQLAKGRSPQEINDFIKTSVGSEVKAGNTAALAGLDVVNTSEPLDLKRQGFLADVARTLVNPAIKGVSIIGEGAGQVGRTVSDLDRIKLLFGKDISEEAGKRIAAEPVNVFAPEEQVRDISGNVGKGVAEGFRGGAGLASLIAMFSGGGLLSPIGGAKAVSTIAPTTTAAKIAGAAGREATIGGLFGAAQPESTVGSTLASAGIGGLAGGTLAGIGPAVSKVLGKTAPKLSDMAEALRQRSFVKRFGRPIKSEGGANFITELDNVAEFKTAKNVNDILEAATKILREEGPTIDGVTTQLSQSGSKISNADEVLKMLDDEIAKAASGKTKKVIQKVKDQVVEDLTTDPSGFYSLKKEYGGFAKWNTFDPSDLKAETNVWGRVYNKMNESLDKSLKDNGFDQFRRVNKRLHIASKAQSFAERQAGKLPAGNNIGLLDAVIGGGAAGITGNPAGFAGGIIGRKVLESPQATNAVSKLLRAGGKVPTSMPQIPSQLARVLNAARIGATGNLETGVPQQPQQQSFTAPAAGISQTQPQTQASSAGDSSQQLALIMKQLKLLDPKNADVYDSLGGGAVKDERNAQQIERESTKALIDDAISQLSTGKIKTGKIGGNVEQIKSVLGIADQATLNFNTTIANLQATIAKARGGTSFTPSEQELLDKYTPKIGDSRQQLETKLLNLKKSFSQ